MSNLAQAVDNTVSGLVTARKPFSAWDITKAISRLGQRERHANVRPIVHNVFQNGSMSDYQRTLVQFPGGNGPAFLYHPPEVDPNDPNVIAGLDATATSAPALPPATQDDDADEDDDDDGSGVQSSGAVKTKTSFDADGAVVKVLGTSKRSTIYIPQHMVTQLGLSRGRAFLDIDPVNKEIKISSNVCTASGSAQQKAFVDFHQNIRIGKTALMKAGLNGAIRIMMDGQQILVSKG